MITLKLNYQRINKLSSSVYISSEIYNTQTKNYISTWSTPRKIIKFPKDCDDICENLIAHNITTDNKSLLDTTHFILFIWHNVYDSNEKRYVF